MKKTTEIKLKEAELLCENKSLEYMIQFMIDTVKVDHDCVMNYLYKNRDK